VERQYQIILNYLVKFIVEKKDWDRWILMFFLAYKSFIHEMTGLIPEMKLYFAQNLRLFLVAGKFS